MSHLLNSSRHPYPDIPVAAVKQLVRHRPTTSFPADFEQHMPLLAGIRELSSDVRSLLITPQPFPWSR
jgi:hypothetical protein